MQEKQPITNLEQERNRLARGEGRHAEAPIEAVPEAKEVEKHDASIAQALEREIRLMEQDAALKQEAETKVKAIQTLADDDKLQNLVDLAKKKGVAFAVKVARDMNDPFLLDTLHDLLAKDGQFKQYAK